MRWEAPHASHASRIHHAARLIHDSITASASAEIGGQISPPSGAV